MGVLVGYNRGTVSNCSVSGYTMEYYGYSASTASLGGFVGSNYGTSQQRFGLPVHSLCKYEL